MTRQKFLRNLIIALALVAVAGLAGQVRRAGHLRNKSRVVYCGTAAEGAPAAVVHDRDVLVRFRSGVTRAQVAALAARFNDRIEDRYESVEGLTAIHDLDGVGVEQVVEDYARETDVVEYVEADQRIYSEPLTGASVALERTESGMTNRITVANQPNDPMFGEQWALSNTGQREGQAGGDIAALKAWAQTKGDAETVVAVLDSGVDYTHPDLAMNMWVRPGSLARYSDAELGIIDDRFGFDADANDGDPMDDNGHGTHCAGILGAVGDNGTGIAGVNWRVSVMPLKFMGKGGFGTTKSAIEAINYVIDRKRAGVPVRVISASWGSTAYSRALEDAIRKAGDEGIIFIAAAGNSSVDADRTPHYPASYKLPNVISVAALDRTDRLASFSNFGAKTVHVAAPGAEIVSTWLQGKYFEASGTSMATPVVAGVAALVLATEPEMKVERLRALLIDSADPLDALKGKVASGGRLNAARALGAE